MSTNDSQCLVILYYMLQISMCWVSTSHVVKGQSAFVNLGEQQRVKAQVYRVYRDTTEMEADTKLAMLQDVM